MTARVLAGGPGIGRIPARKLARDELARSIYRPSWFARVLRDIENWLASLVSSGPAGRPSWWAILVLSIIVLAAVAAVLYWLGPARLTTRLRGRPVIGDRTRTAADYRAAADGLAAAGNYQAAVIERVRAIAAELEASGILLPRPARTAAELAAETGTVFPAEAAGLTTAARLFDEARYGGRAGSAAGYAEVAGVDLRLQAAAAGQFRPSGAGKGSTREDSAHEASAHEDTAHEDTASGAAPQHTGFGR